jgi:hypothetical protein
LESRTPSNAILRSLDSIAMDFSRKTTTCDDDAEDPLAASPGERISGDDDEDEDDDDDDDDDVVVAVEDSRYDVISVGDIPFSCACVFFW